MPDIFISYFCYNKLPQTWWLRTAHTYSCSPGGLHSMQRSGIGFTGIKSKCWHSWFLLKALSGESISLPFSVAISNLYLVWGLFLYLQSLLASLHHLFLFCSLVSVWLPLFKKSFFKLLLYCSHPNISPFAFLHPSHLLFSQSIPTLLSLSMGYLYIFFV